MSSRMVEVKMPDAHPRMNGFHSLRSDVAHEAEDQTNWLVSYLDLMTLLFAFFVVLFAHQKIMNRVVPAEAAQVQVESVVEAEDEAADEPSESSAPEVLPQTAEQIDQAAIVAMKAQTLLDGFKAVSAAQVSETQKPASTTLDSGHLSDAAVFEPTVVPFFSAPSKKSEVEQTALKFTSALAQEPARKQVEILPEDQDVRLEINDTILFDPGKVALKSSGQAMLDRLVVVLNQQQGVISVEGHTDTAPIANAQYPSNWELSAARASSVTRYLALKGIPSNRLRAVGMADTKPRDSNASLQGRAKNRRVSLALYVEEKHSVN